MMTIPGLEAKALEIRKQIVRIALEGDYGHVASALSCVEILVALYYEVMGEDDVCIISKGHAALAQYAILVDRDSLDVRELPGCLERGLPKAVRCSTGSLGHGLPFAVGIALAKRLKRAPGRVYCLVGDAELQEGSCYEALMLSADLAPQFYVIADGNELGAMQKISCPNITLDGHSFETLTTMLDFSPGDKDDDSVWLKTTKGKGIPFMEGKPEWHFRPPSQWTQEQRSWVDSWLSSDSGTAPSST